MSSSEQRFATEYSSVNEQKLVIKEGLAEIPGVSEEIVEVESLSIGKSASDIEQMSRDILLWAQEDPEAALRFVMEDLRPRNQRYELITAILQQWARADPQIAWKWTFENLPTESGPVIREVAKADGNFAWQMASEYVALHEGDHMISRVAYRAALSGLLNEGNYYEAVEVLNTRDFPLNEESYGRVAATIVEEWSHYRPEEAITWLEKNANALGMDMDTALSHAWTSFATSDPELAIQLAAKLDDDFVYKDSIVSMAMFRIMESGDIATSEQWLKTYGDDGIEFDWNRVALASHTRVVREDPIRAIGWASQVVEESARQDAYKGALVEWLVIDAEGAGKFLEDNPAVLTERNLYRAYLEAEAKIVNEASPVIYSHIR